MFFVLARTNSCIDTLELRMPNNHSLSGFGYKHRPGLFCFVVIFEMQMIVDLLNIGHACAGTAGYCDVFGKCRAVDAEGPLTRLKNMLLNEENIRTLTQLTQVENSRERILFYRCFSFQRNTGGHLSWVY